MKIIHTPSLSREQAHDIRTITDLCRQTDGTTLSCPGDGDHFWLLYGDGSRMQAFLAVYKMDGSSWECSAFTRPGCRNQGYFHALLEQACRDSQEEGGPDLCFVTDNRCPDTLKVLRHLDAEFLYDEYMMEIDLPLAEEGPGLQNLDSRYHVFAECLEEDGEMSLTMWITPGGDSSATDRSCPDSLTDSRDRLPAGTCRIVVHGTGAYLYGLEILPRHRKKGLGTWFLYHIMSRLAGQGCRRLRLQVSGTNAPALGFYRKTGYRITETLSYYLY